MKLHGYHFDFPKSRNLRPLRRRKFLVWVSERPARKEYNEFDA